jgi:hypothetical protein
LRHVITEEDARNAEIYEGDTSLLAKVGHGLYTVRDLSGDPEWTKFRDSGSLVGYTHGDGIIHPIIPA